MSYGTFKTIPNYFKKLGLIILALMAAMLFFAYHALVGYPENLDAIELANRATIYWKSISAACLIALAYLIYYLNFKMLKEI